MNPKTGRLSKRDMQVLERALKILSDWGEVVDAVEDDPWEDYSYDVAMSAVTGLTEFIGSYEES